MCTSHATTPVESFESCIAAKATSCRRLAKVTQACSRFRSPRTSNCSATFAAAPGTGTATGERNFLPFIPWASARGGVVTFPCTDPSEAIGVNTPDDLEVVERTLRQRATETT